MWLSGDMLNCVLGYYHDHRKLEEYLTTGSEELITFTFLELEKSAKEAMLFHQRTLPNKAEITDYQSFLIFLTGAPLHIIAFVFNFVKRHSIISYRRLIMDLTTSRWDKGMSFIWDSGRIDVVDYLFQHIVTYFRERLVGLAELPQRQQNALRNEAQRFIEYPLKTLLSHAFETNNLMMVNYVMSKNILGTFTIMSILGSRFHYIEDKMIYRSLLYKDARQKLYHMLRMINVFGTKKAPLALYEILVEADVIRRERINVFTKSFETQLCFEDYDRLKFFLNLSDEYFKESKIVLLSQNIPTILAMGARPFHGGSFSDCFNLLAHYNFRFSYLLGTIDRSFVDVISDSVIGTREELLNICRDHDLRLVICEECEGGEAGGGIEEPEFEGRSIMVL